MGLEHFQGNGALAGGDAFVVVRVDEGEPFFRTAVSRYELALDLARRTRGYLTREASIVSSLARAQLGMGELGLARTTAEEAVRIGLERGTPVFEAEAQLVRAEALRATEGNGLRPEIERSLHRCSELIEQTGARLYTPQVYEQRAAMDILTGDDAARERHLGKAHRLYTEMGATGHAERLEKELGL